MSDTFDPFADSASTEDVLADAVEDAIEDGVVDEIEDIFADLDDLEEVESGDVVQARDSRSTYSDPAEVGLKDKMWVPIRIGTAEVIKDHTPRLSAKTCIAVKKVTNPETGKTTKKVYALYDQVEAMLKNGAEEVVGEFKLPYFVAEANHVAPRFGARRFPYEIEVPVFSIKTAYFREQRNGKTGRKNENGRSLRQATGATEAGETVNKANMDEVADRMVDKIVMAQVSLSTTKTGKLREKLDELGNPITVLIDPKTADAVCVVLPEGSETYVFEDSGEVYEGAEGLLVPITDRKFAIRDNGEKSDVLRERYWPVTDYINPPFQPVPERNVTIERIDGSEAQGEITWDTVGAITLGNTAGVRVDALLKSGEKLGADIGKTVTIVWLGTFWQEVAPEGDGLDEFVGNEIAA